MPSRQDTAFHLPLRKFSDPRAEMDNWRRLERFLQNIASDDLVGATVVVAASDSVDPTQAHYQCDGVADESEIQDALDDIALGGRLIFLDGTFVLSAGLTVSDKQTLEGQGHSTILDCSGIASPTAGNSTYVFTGTTLTDFQLRNFVMDAASKLRVCPLSVGGVYNQRNLLLDQMAFKRFDDSSGNGNAVINMGESGSSVEAYVIISFCLFETIEHDADGVVNIFGSNGNGTFLAIGNTLQGITVDGGGTPTFIDASGGRGLIIANVWHDSFGNYDSGAANVYKFHNFLGGSPEADDHTVYAPTAADYLVGTAQAGLSAEIVVGTTPGGELGGTWASPTVDATHSGSAHHTESHAARHAENAADELLVEDLGTAGLTAGRYPRTDGLGGLAIAQIDHGEITGLADDDHTIYASRQDSNDGDSGWNTFTPSWTASVTNPTIGNGILDGRYIQFGKIVYFLIHCQAGSTTTFGSGTYRLSLPVTAVSGMHNAFSHTQGCFIRDAIPGTHYHFLIAFDAVNTRFELVAEDSNARWTDSSPFTFANLDQIRAFGIYEAA